MPFRNQIIRLSAIAVLVAFAVTALPAAAAPAASATRDDGPASLWSLLDEAWQWIVTSITGASGDDGEMGPIMDPNGVESTGSDGQDMGPIMDPNGLEMGPIMDPNG